MNFVLAGIGAGSSKLALNTEEQLLLQYFREASPAVRKAAMAALLSGSSASGASMSMIGMGDGNVQIGGGGSLSGSVSVKKGK